MGARRGAGARGWGFASPWNLKVTSYATILQNALNFSLTPALAIDPLYFSLKGRENAKFFFCAFRGPKNGRFFVRRAKNVSTF